MAAKRGRTLTNMGFGLFWSIDGATVSVAVIPEDTGIIYTPSDTGEVKVPVDTGRIYIPLSTGSIKTEK